MAVKTMFFKISAVGDYARYTLCQETGADLEVTGIPLGVTAARVATLANATIIHSRFNECARTAYGELGLGKFLNLVKKPESVTA